MVRWELGWLLLHCGSPGTLTGPQDGEATHYPCGRGATIEAKIVPSVREDKVVNESDASKRPADTPRGVILPPGEGRTLPGAEVITMKLTSEETNGSIGVLEGITPPGAGPPRHIHRSCDELFYVLEGEFLFLVGERQATAQPGTLVFIPRGTVHAAKVLGTEPGKVLIAYVPGGQERAFEEFGRLPRDAVAEKYDSEFVGPPL
jgi:quercetin dioxygenase-like cupin family protein